jgi:proline iminopeptidase
VSGSWTGCTGAGNLFPEAWASFAALVPSGDPLLGYHRLVNDPDPDVRARAAEAWSNWEGAAVSLTANPVLAATYADPAFAVPFARIALHYFVHRGWLELHQLVRDAGKLAGIPGRIVQGRYDAVSPPVTAWDLHRAWPSSQLRILPDAGHAVTDRGILDALLDATDEFGALTS